MIVKRFEVVGSLASTLDAEEVCENHEWQCGDSSRTHKDGWTISGNILQDWGFWVNTFEASHPDFGRVWGDFESEVFATSEAAFQDFYEKHPPFSWDYGDI